jgi:hypothetical protein
MKSKLVWVILCGMLTTASLLGGSGNQVVAQCQNSAQTGIRPRVLNYMLRQAAPFWQMNLGQARQAYTAGRVSIVLVSREAGVFTYVLELDNDCPIQIIIDDLD